jgi:GNAT superfamily N-acetyltransferase
MNRPDQAGSDQIDRDLQTLREYPAPAGVSLRFWTEDDFPAVQALSTAEGWTTPSERPAESLVAWRASWPAIIAEADGQRVGFLRAISDGAVSTYVAGLLIAPDWRGRGVGRALLGACQALVPSTRLDLLSEPDAVDFYSRLGFRPAAGFRRRRLT